MPPGHLSPGTTPGGALPGYGEQPGDATAVMGRRFVAWILDLVLFVAVVVASFVALAEYVPADESVTDACEQLEALPDADVASCLDLRDAGIAEFEDRVYVTHGADAGIQTLVVLGYFAFFVLLQGVTGGSPGKLLTGVRVVDEHGRPAGVGKSLGRTLLWVVDGAPWIVPFVGPIVALTSTGHRRVGDMAAGTYVVGAASVGRPVRADGLAPPEGSTWTTRPPSWPGSPPPSAGPPPAPDAGRAGVADGSPMPEDVELDIRSLDVPPPTERADVSPPHIGADPRWWDDPSLHVDAPPEYEAHDGAASGPEPPTWEPPSSPGVDDPMDDWRPPTSPGFDPEPPSPSDAPEPSDHDHAVADVDASRESARQRADEHPGAPPGGPAPFVPPGGDASTRDTGVSDPWGTGTTGTAGTGSAAGSPSHFELPPPQWDAARGTYIQWDPNRAAWLQWDAARERWKPIDT